MIFLTVIAINFVGDGLRDVFDPEGATRIQPGFKRRVKKLMTRGPIRPDPAILGPFVDPYSGGG